MSHSADIAPVLKLARQWWIKHTPGGGRWLRHADYLQMYTNVNSGFDVVGQSVEGREIREYSWGNGSRGAILWSQMHGNEATATYALCDLLLFLERHEGNSAIQALKKRVHIRIIPMVNPDGAEQFSRRNALGIDPNRDARALQSVESQLLLDRIKRSGAEVAFNLHDQRNIFHLANTRESAVISFLAPSADVERGVSPTRKVAMNWVCYLQKCLKEHHPAGAAKYTDEYYPTAFGENAQALGVPTVLIESGGTPGDPNRLVARKLNFLLLVDALYSLALPDSRDAFTQMDYDAIPLNGKNQWDVLIRDVQIGSGSSRATVSLGVLFEFQPDRQTGELKVQSCIGDVGDLDDHCGLESWSAEGALFENGERLPRLKEQASFRLFARGQVVDVVDGLRVRP